MSVRSLFFETRVSPEDGLASRRQLCVRSTETLGASLMGGRGSRVDKLSGPLSVLDLRLPSCPRETRCGPGGTLWSMDSGTRLPSVLTLSLTRPSPVLPAVQVLGTKRASFARVSHTSLKGVRYSFRTLPRLRSESLVCSPSGVTRCVHGDRCRGHW